MSSSLIESLASKCRVATAHDSVLNSECAYTFHSPFTTDQGVVVNLNTFMGTIQDMAFEGSSETTGIFVRIAKKRVQKETVDAMNEDDDGDKAKPTKLGIGVEGGFQGEEDKYEIVSNYSVVVLKKEGDAVVAESETPYTEETKPTLEAVSKSVDSIIQHSGMAVQQDLKVWELDDEPKPVSKCYESLPFVDNGVMISPNPSDWKCQKSEDTENLWLNLSDGYIGGGRKNWDGSGGSNGALDHYEETGKKYPLVVKLGTITADLETADCYSYASDEDGPVKIPNLAELLEKRGIKVSAMQKTVKSTAELEVELNATYAFDAITEAGANLTPVSGPSLQGLQNLGNSCYMNSVVQLLLSGTVPELSNRYGTKAGGSLADQPLLKKVSPKEATSDMLVQTAKISSALTSGVFAGPVPESATVTDSSSNDPKYRIQPRMFKHVVGADHVDFRTGQQQDAAQYLLYMLEKMDRAERGGVAAERIEQTDSNTFVSSHLFSFKTMDRLVCTTDKKIKYKESETETMLSLPVPMEKASILEEPEQKRPKTEETKEDKPVPTISLRACLDSWGAENTVDDYRWPHLGKQVAPALSQSRLSNFPRYLIVQVQRYTLGADWTPQKLEVNLDIPEELDLTDYKTTGPQDGEVLVPEEEEEGATTSAQLNAPPAIDEAALSQLMDMGFSLNGSKRALTAVGGSDVQAAMTWVFEHNMDPDFNDPLPEPEAAPTAAAASDGSGVDEGVVMSLVESLGCFTIDQVRAALKETNGAADRAADWLFSHMDDLDGAIAALESKSASSAAAPAASLLLEDGEGKYTMMGMVSHIGKHTGSGHYVAHVKRDGKWVIFNDEKVALSESPPFAHAYLYLYQRNDTIGSPHQGY